MAKRLFSNLWLLVVVGLAAVLTSGWASFVSGQWHWFGRSGSIMTMCGVLLSIRPLVRMGLASWIQHQHTFDGGHVVPTPEEIEASRQTVLDSRASQMGAVMALVGTIIWAYGDLVGGLIRG